MLLHGTVSAAPKDGHSSTHLSRSALPRQSDVCIQHTVGKTATLQVAHCNSNLTLQVLGSFASKTLQAAAVGLIS